MGEHANGYLTLAVRISQGRIANNLSPVLDRRGKCSTALRGMPRRELVSTLRLRWSAFQLTPVQVLADKRGPKRADQRGIEVGLALLQFHRRAGLFELRL